jgi:hypothetical protein
VILSGHDRGYSETYRAETYAQQNQKIAQQDRRCTLRERSSVETLAGLLTLDLPMLQKYVSTLNTANGEYPPNFNLTTTVKVPPFAAARPQGELYD